MGSSKVVWSDRKLVNNLMTFDARMDRGITAALALHATRAVAYARTNASWVDRTTNARNGLFSRVERDRPIYRLIVAHSVPYGVWLEIRFNGRYAIIRPTIDKTGPEVMTTISLLYSKMFGGR